jgi:hypothetical protein
MEIFCRQEYENFSGDFTVLEGGVGVRGKNTKNVDHKPFIYCTSNSQQSFRLAFYEPVETDR